MPDDVLESLGVRRHGGRYQLVGRLEQLLDRPLPDSATVLGLGLRGLTAAAVLAAVRGRDLGFVRSQQKSHGTGRILDGAEVGDTPLVVVTHPADRSLLDLVPHSVDQVVLLAEPGDRDAATLPKGYAAPEAPAVDPRDHVEVLTGSFVTTSGFRVERYVETVRAACTYPVARQFAEMLRPTLLAVRGVCAIAHGGALLAAVAAASRGLVADLFHPPHADGSPAFAHPTCFLDDYIMIGAAQRTACLAVASAARPESRFVAVYGPVPEVDFGEQRADVLVVTDVGQRPPASPFLRTGGT